jgi:AraC-like DNA-binding protein
MQVGKILYYGLYDSQKMLGGVKVSPVRKTSVFELDYILSCSDNATSYIQGKSCKLTPNMLVLRKPNQTSNSKLHFKCYFIHFQVDSDSPIYNELFSMPEYFTFINDKVYQPLFESIFKHLVQNHDNETDYFISSKLLELIYHLQKDQKHNLQVKPTSLQKENLCIKTAVEYITKHFDKPLCLKDLGQLTGYSPNHFQRIFTFVMGVSPQKYLEGLRIEHAKYLLAKNLGNLTEIAYECGFSSQSYFSKVFKKHTLLTPNEFMQNTKFMYLRSE